MPVSISNSPILNNNSITARRTFKYPTSARCRKVAQSGANVQKVVNIGRICYNKSYSKRRKKL